MLILGIESTCDETAASVVKDGNEVLSNIVASQEKLHLEFGGVVPEIACRAHLDAITIVIDKAVSGANIELKDLDAIAVANTPGLVGALLIGVTAAKSMAWALNIPLIAVNHLYAHLYSVNLSQKRVQYPLIGLLASGGHTSLFLAENVTDYKYLGGTLDDAAGEAFDKVSKILGLGYPGGPEIDKASKSGFRDAVKFPRSYLKKDSLDFSFSGLKTAVLYHYYGKPGFKNSVDRETKACASPHSIGDIAASFQEAVVEVLVNKTMLAFQKQKRISSPAGIAVGGGVTRNARLREKFEEAANDMDIPVHYPEPEHCTDNAAMIAGLAFHNFKKGDAAGLALEAFPNYRR